MLNLNFILSNTDIRLDLLITEIEQMPLRYYIILSVGKIIIYLEAIILVDHY